jgi:pilus assembly protein CpaB
MNKRLIGVAVAALLALLGTIVILRYVNDADERARADVELVEVFVIEEKVPAGAGEAELRSAIGTTEVAANTVVDGVLTDLLQLDGKVAAVDLVPGEQVLLNRLIDSASFNQGKTRLTSVPDGLLEITVSLEPQRLVGGQVVPGDTVGVIASFEPFKINGITEEGLRVLSELSEDEYLRAVEALSAVPENIDLVNTTHFLMHKILVTRVQVEELPQEQYDAEGNPVDTGVLSPTGNLLVTLAVEPHDAERLVFSAEFGTLWVTYEPESADDHDSTESTHRDNVYGHPHEDETGGDVITTSDTAEAAS